MWKQVLKPEKLSYLQILKVEAMAEEMVEKEEEDAVKGEAIQEVDHGQEVEIPMAQKSENEKKEDHSMLTTTKDDELSF